MQALLGRYQWSWRLILEFDATAEKMKRQEPLLTPFVLDARPQCRKSRHRVRESLPYPVRMNCNSAKCCTTKLGSRGGNSKPPYCRPFVLYDPSMMTESKILSSIHVNSKPPGLTPAARTARGSVPAAETLAFSVSVYLDVLPRGPKRIIPHKAP